MEKVIIRWSAVKKHFDRFPIGKSFTTENILEYFEESIPNFNWAKSRNTVASFISHGVRNGIIEKTGHMVQGKHRKITQYIKRTGKKQGLLRKGEAKHTEKPSAEADATSIGESIIALLLKQKKKIEELHIENRELVKEKAQLEQAIRKLQEKLLEAGQKKSKVVNLHDIQESLYGKTVLDK